MRAILDFILPPRCRICDTSTVREPIVWVCRDCWLAIDYVIPPICYQCGQPFAAPPEGIASLMHRCGECLHDPPPYERARALGLYRGAFREIIHAMKYQRVYGLVRPLAELLQAQFVYHWEDCMPDGLVPVPLHRSRLRQREFDQALGLSHVLSRSLNMPLWADVLVRHRNTTSQVGLQADERQDNVRGAFRVQAPGRCEGKAILLIDDVYTTGATAKECARVLRQAGAARVDVYTLARVE